MRILKLLQLFILFAILLLVYCNGMAQYKSFDLSDKKDTLNAIDKNDLKQGKWIIHVAELRGEPGYEEEGIYKNGKREGTWRSYNLTGDLIARENYFNGGKDGIQQYFTFFGDLIRQESWRAYDPDKPYDTVLIYGTGNSEVISTKIVKAVPYSVKHGEWKFFDPTTKNLIKIENYDHGFLLKPDAVATAKATIDKPKKAAKTAEMIEWEKKNKGKKKVLRDGSTGL